MADLIRVKLGLLAALFAVHAVLAQTSKLPVLTQARQVSELSADQAEFQRVELDGWRALWTSIFWSPHTTPPGRAAAAQKG